MQHAKRIAALIFPILTLALIVAGCGPGPARLAASVGFIGGGVLFWSEGTASDIARRAHYR